MTDDTTTVEMKADLYERDKSVASDGRLWLGEDFAGEDVEVAIRKTNDDTTETPA